MSPPDANLPPHEKEEEPPSIVIPERLLRPSWRQFFSRQFLKYLGPGFLVTVGFIDPGNWATNIAGGADFQYSLLWVISLSTLMLILLQNMSARLGLITGRSLAANIRAHLPRWLSNFLGATIFFACAATDVAELLGAAIGFYLLFGLPLPLGALITVIITIVAILGQHYHKLERMIIGFLAIIAACYVAELFIVSPEWGTLLPNVFIPRVDSKSIYVAVGMLGAVVMPHNIYLHANVIQSRDWTGDENRKRALIRFELADTTIAMLLGWVVNSAMIIVAAAVFFRHGVPVNSIEQAAETLRPLAGPLAQLLFGVALLFAGIGSFITSSMAEVNVVTGFLGKPEDPRTFLYRLGLVVTSIPAFVIIAMGLDSYRVLILSQVVLSLQLPFTIVPLLVLVKSRRIMGAYASGKIETTLAIIVAAIIIALNSYLLYSTFRGQ